MKRMIQKTVFEFFDRFTPRVSHSLRMAKAVHPGSSEPEINHIVDFIDSSKDAVDIGAHRGVYAMVMAKRARRVHALEPHPRLYRYLTRVMPRNVKVYNLAASDQKSVLDLHIPRGGGYFGLGQGTLENPDYFDSNNKVVSEEVRAEPLDDTLDTPIGFIKIDVEGHEPSAIRGALGLISAHKPTILVEIVKRNGESKMDDIRGLLTPLGYQGYFLNDGRWRPLAEFSFDEYQAPGSQFDADKPFVNNFLFTVQSLDASAAAN